MLQGGEIIVVMPAYNFEKKLRQTYDELPNGKKLNIQEHYEQKR
jgi:hypothetical protein